MPALTEGRYHPDVPSLNLPTDHPRPALPSFAVDTAPVALPGSLVAALTALSNHHAVSLQTTLLAVWQILLSRHARQDEFQLGIRPSAAGGDKRSGFREKPLVIRADLAGDLSVAALLQRVSAALRHARPVDALLPRRPGGWTSPAEGTPAHPRVPVCFAFDPAPARQYIGPAPPAPTANAAPTAQPYDLSLSLATQGEAVRGTLAYNRVLFDPPTIVRMGDQYVTLLTSILADPLQPVSIIPLLTPAEQTHMLMTGNDTAMPFRHDTCIHVLFEECVERDPDAVAVVCGGQSLTYSELNARANQLAHHLRAHGVGPNTPVAICVEQSLAMIIGMFGILKAGGAYVPLDPASPRERLAWMLADVRAPILVTQERLVARAPRYDGRVICLDTDWPAIARANQENPPRAVSPDDLVYIIYTSGSTGTPKGVMVTHRNLVHSTQARYTYQRAPIRAFLMLLPFAFDASVGGIFPTLCQGGALIYPTEAEQRDPRILAMLIQRVGISHFNCLPSVYALLLAHAPTEAFERLDTVRVGGEACPRTLVETHFRLLPHVRLCNDYGPTEATVWCSVYECMPNDPHPRVPIGRPIPNMRLFVLDQHDQPVPIGVPGELCISGAGLSRGYYGRPDLTAERFVPQPFPRAGDARMYRTGDLARFLPDGNIDFLGRLDDQVKIRGVRIELAEIERAILRHPHVRDAAVLAHDLPSGEKRLVAYVAARHGATLGSTELYQVVKEHVPREMIPATFHILATLPRTSHGKIDRQALPTQGLADADRPTPIAPPSTALEGRLQAIWEETLSRQQIGIHDDFFAVRLLARIEEDLGIRLPVATLFHASTIAQLAHVIRLGGSQARSAVIVPLQRQGTNPPFFCVHGLGGSVMPYVHLARLMAPDWPFYGMQAPEINGLTAPSASVAELAAAYLQEVQRAQPEGPYYLGGFSSGGTIAYEMAQQLRAHGEHVACLVMLDAPAPSYWDVRVTPRVLANAALTLTYAVREFVKLSLRARSLGAFGSMRVCWGGSSSSRSMCAQANRHRSDRISSGNTCAAIAKRHPQRFARWWNDMGSCCSLTSRARMQDVLPSCVRRRSPYGARMIRCSAGEDSLMMAR